MLSKINSNLVVLIPKIPSADKVKDFIPTALANFQSKTITNVLVDRLATIAPSILSENQRAFKKGRHISDCVSIALKLSICLIPKLLVETLPLNLTLGKPLIPLIRSFC